MRSLPVIVPTIKQLIQPSPGFEKKELSQCKLDILGLCGFGCTYCSSNNGYYLRKNRKLFLAETERQLGIRVLPADEPALTFLWRDVVPKLEAELAHKRPGYGEGLTLVFSMLTDGFSPLVVKDGTTEAVLRLILANTAFRIRILTKNSVVGSSRWIRLFADFPDRFVVGLSTGTDDDGWARAVELGTPSPSSRLRALRRVQDAGIPTYGMLCPVFPDVLEGDRLDRLVDRIRPDLVEHVWSEPFNDRVNWRAVRDGYDPASPGYAWLTDVYEHGNKAAWSSYATQLYTRLRAKAEREGWLPKLKYLLYEGDITSRGRVGVRWAEGRSAAVDAQR